MTRYINCRADSFAAFDPHAVLALLLLVFSLIGDSLADGPDLPSKGQTVYVPVYSEIWHGNLGASGRAENVLMSILVSIRNTDPKTPITIVAAPYYDTNGKLIRNYVPTRRVIAPFGTAELFVEIREKEGGSGANFAIQWETSNNVSPPIIEALHTRYQAGYSLAFISRGKVISSP